MEFEPGTQNTGETTGNRLGQGKGESGARGHGSSAVIHGCLCPWGGGGNIPGAIAGPFVLWELLLKYSGEVLAPGHTWYMTSVEPWQASHDWRMEEEDLDRRLARRLTRLEHYLVRNYPVVYGCMQQSDTLLVLSGDHSSTLVPFRAFMEKYGLKQGGQEEGGSDLGLLWIDAHADIHTPLTSPSLNPHGMPVALLLDVGADRPPRLRRSRDVFPASVEVWERLRKRMHGWPDRSLDEEGAFPSVRLAYLGVRSCEPEEIALIGERGIPVWAFPGEPRGLPSLIDTIVEYFSGVKALYVSLDVDVLDASVMQCTGTPEPGGPGYGQLQEVLIGVVRRLPVKVLEVAECNPGRGPSEHLMWLVRMLAVVLRVWCGCGHSLGERVDSGHR